MIEYQGFFLRWIADQGSSRAVGDRRGAHERRAANRHCPAAGYFARRRLRADSDSADPIRLKRAPGREPWRPKAQNHSEPDARWTQAPEQQEPQPDARNTQVLLPVAATIAPKHPDLARPAGTHAGSRGREPRPHCHPRATRKPFKPAQVKESQTEISLVKKRH